MWGQCSDCAILSAMESMLYSAPFWSQRCTVHYFSSKPVCQRCESAIVEFSFSAGKSFSQSSHSALLSSVSVLYQRPPFPALAPWHAADSSFYRSPEGTQLQSMLPLIRENINTVCTVHSLHTRLMKVYRGTKIWKESSDDRNCTWVASEFTFVPWNKFQYLLLTTIFNSIFQIHYFMCCFMRHCSGHRKDQNETVKLN